MAHVFRAQEQANCNRLECPSRLVHNHHLTLRLDLACGPLGLEVSKPSVSKDQVLGRGWLGRACTLHFRARHRLTAGVPQDTEDGNTRFAVFVPTFVLLHIRTSRSGATEAPHLPAPPCYMSIPVTGSTCHLLATPRPGTAGPAGGPLRASGSVATLTHALTPVPSCPGLHCLLQRHPTRCDGRTSSPHLGLGSSLLPRLTPQPPPNSEVPGQAGPTSLPSAVWRELGAPS